MTGEERGRFINQVQEVVKRQQANEQYSYFNHFINECNNYGLGEADFNMQVLKQAFKRYKPGDVGDQERKSSKKNKIIAEDPEDRNKIEDDLLTEPEIFIEKMVTPPKLKKAPKPKQIQPPLPAVKSPWSLHTRWIIILIVISGGFAIFSIFHHPAGQAPDNSGRVVLFKLINFDYENKQFTDAKKNFSLLSAADRQYLTDSLNNRGDFLSGQKKFSEALNIFDESSIVTGNARSQCALGNIYHNGLGVKPSDSTALNYYLKADSAKYDSAKYYLGMLYARGSPEVPRDLLKAYDYMAWITCHAKNKLLITSAIEQIDSINNKKN